MMMITNMRRRGMMVKGKRIMETRKKKTDVFTTLNC